MEADAERESARARRYLLGQASDEECTAIEREYFADERAIDRVAAAEDDLIDDYISSRLDEVERDRFEREYLKSSRHRARVETARLLRTRARAGIAGSWLVARRWPSLAAAAVLILVAAGTLWRFTPARDDNRTVSGPPPTSIPTSAPAQGSSPPTVFAVSVSPVTVRGASESADVIIPAGTDVLRVNLDVDAERRPLTRAHASIRTVGGAVVWDGPAKVNDLPPGVIAQLDAPAAKLLADDYVIALAGADETGVERERARYFLRVRAR